MTYLLQRRQLLGGRMPFGLLGRLGHAMVVRRQLASIFDHRARAIGGRFPFRAAGGGRVVFG